MISQPRLPHRRVVLTGASSGIGEQLAWVLAREGADLVLVARREERLQALSNALRLETGRPAQVEALDLSDPASPEILFGRTGPVDLLVNNAGFGSLNPFEEEPWSRYDQMLRVNVIAPTALCHLYLPGMKANRFGHILNIASLAAFTPSPQFAVYAATKAYLRHFSEALHHECLGTGVQVTAFHPGIVRSGFQEAAAHRLKGLVDRAAMTSEQAARLAVEAMLRGRASQVGGFTNVLLAGALDVLPRSWAVRLTDLSTRQATETTSRNS